MSIPVILGVFELSITLLAAPVIPPCLDL